MTTNITMVQFLSIHDYKFWEPDRLKMYYVGSQNVREEFEDTFENDDGDEEVQDLVIKRCLAVYASYEDYLNGDEVCYVPKEDSDYILTTLKVNINEDHDILGLAQPTQEEGL